MREENWASGILRNYIYVNIFLKGKYFLSFMSGAAVKKYGRVQKNKGVGNIRGWGCVAAQSRQHNLRHDFRNAPLGNELGFQLPHHRLSDHHGAWHVVVSQEIHVNKEWILLWHTPSSSKPNLHILTSDAKKSFFRPYVTIYQLSYIHSKSYL